MRAPLTLAALVAVSLAAAQSPKGAVFHGSIYRSQQVFIDCAGALPRLYDRREFDSIAFYIQQRIKTSPGFQPDLYALRILWEIQQHRFAPDSAQDAFLYYGLDAYVRAAEVSQSEGGYFGMFATPDYDPRPAYQQEFATLAHWAEDLIETRRLGNAESFLCRTFAGDFEHPREAARADKTGYWQINSMLDASAVNRRKAGVLNLYGGAGIWIPKGRLALFGDHPSITAVGIGKKYWNSEWDFVMAFRFVHTAQPYNVLRQDSVYSVDNFFGGYIGIDYTRYLLHAKRLEAGVVCGVGFDGFDVNDHYSDATPTGPPPPTSINSLNLNLGGKINVYLGPKHYIGVIGRYNFIQYSNPGGTPLDGNAVAVDLIVGFN
ncbi:MAG TPA: hypothetical protein VHE34_20870 [Puia sp.]|uniref:hypothetical protein n=1 Tax=Puia sp. TaxID=2045100 RepID=UPI002C486308|nr:hypothetical protein [Puia sp.]HVU97695.1 hypothetical protein [Puia sp.]